MRLAAIHRLTFAATVATTLAVGCSSSTEPASIAGSYKATTFQFSTAGSPSVDALAEGFTLSMTISSSNTTSGALYVPASYTDDEIPLTLNLAGTATRSGSTVRFSQTEDTPIRDIAFTVSGTALQADQTVSGTRVVIVLTRQ